MLKTMLTRLMILVVLLAGALALAQAQDAAPREILTVLATGEGVFEPGLWLASAAEREDFTTAEWRADSINGLAYLTYYHFDDGILDTQIPEVFNDAWLNSYFANYQQVRQVSTCTIGTVTLREYSVLSNGVRSTILFWIEPAAFTRVQTIFIAFPTDQRAQLDDYAARLYPDAAVCAG